MEIKNNKIFLYLFMVSLFYLSCEESIKPKTVTFSGTINLESETDHSGVKVSLYKPVVLDTAIVRINQQYPQIGVQISQETEFDHRDHSPLYSITTNASGSWSIENVTPGTYNVVAEKDSFGWDYDFEKNETQINSDTLYSALYLNGFINSSITASIKQFLIIEKDVVFTNSSELTLEGDNTILISQNKKLTIEGSIISNEQKQLKITSYDLENLGRGLVLNANGNIKFNNLIVSHLSQGILFETNSNLNGAISNSIFKKCTIIGIYAQNDSISIENSIFNDFDSYSIECLNNFSIQKNIFINTKGILIRDCNGLVKNNLFESNKIAITPYKGQINIINNEFLKNNVSIAVNSSDCSIKLNIFSDNFVDIELNKNYLQASFEYANPDIEFNNFYNSDTAVTVWGNHSLYGSGNYSLGVGINNNLEIPNCFWYYTNTFSIDQLILDVKDDTQYLYYIIYSPFEMSALQDAGIH